MFHGNPVITLTGGLVSEPEIRFTQGGIAWCQFTVVTVDRKRTEGGSFEDVDKTYWDCTAWRRTAENLCDSGLKPGDRVIVLGQVKQENWETKDGDKRSKHKVQADHIGVGLDFRSVSVNRAERTAAPEAATVAPDEAPF